MAADLTVRFVKGCTEETNSVFQEAFEALQDIGSAGIWFSNEECLAINEKNRAFIYVFQDFDGDAFRHIAKTGNRIYGPVCLLHCLKMSEPLPKVAQPVYNQALKGLTISCTCIVKEKRERIHDLIGWMHGQVSKDFHQDVTHLVAGEVGSKKYLVAAKLKKAIMCPTWIEETWKASQTRLTRGDDVSLMDAYRCPIFLGFVLTASGLDNEAREDVRRVVEREGGRYSGVMRINECTHLVINEPKGQKYECGKKWKIHIVRPEWISDSIRAGYCLEEFHYALDSATTSATTHSTSTPSRELQKSYRQSALPDMSAISMTHINDTVTNQSRLVSPDDTTQPPTHGSSVTGSSRTEMDAFDALQPSAVTNDMCLDGCKIFFSGFAGSRLEKLRRLINLGGGTRYNELSAVISHVVIGDIVESDISTLQQADFRPHVVRVGWLLECIKLGHPASEDAYLCMQPTSLEDPAIIPPQHAKINQQKAAPSLPAVAKPMKPVEPEADNEDADMHELLSQYLPQQASTAAADLTNESALIRAAEAGEAGIRGNPETSRHAVPVNDDDETLDPDATRDVTATLNPYRSAQLDVNGTSQAVTHDESTQDPDMTVVNGNATVSGLFGGRTFVILGFSSEDESQLQEFVTENGGRVLSARSRRVPDYAVVPLFGCPVTMTVHEIVTNAWLQMCLEESSVLDIHSNELFTPLSVQTDAEPLKGCVLSISGYTGTERDVLVHVAELIGARCQEYFVRSHNKEKQLDASTHLIVDAAQGTKYKAAKKWKLPAVSKYWLLECAKTGQRAPEADFMVDAQPPPTKSSDHHVTPKLAENANISRPRQSTSGEDANQTRRETPMATTVNDPGGDVQDRSLAGKENACEQIRKEEQGNVMVTSGESVTLIGLRNQRVKELIQTNTPGQRSPKVNLGVDTPGKFLAPGKEFRPNYDLSAVMSALNSPANQMTPSGRNQKRLSLPLDEMLTDHLAIALQNSTVPHDPGVHNADTTHNPLPIIESLKPTGPLKGVVIGVSKKLSCNQAEYNSQASALGAEYRWAYDTSCTHFIFRGRQNDMNKEFRRARDEGKVIVSPHWLTACQEQLQHVDESLYPHTYNPNLSLCMSTKKDTPVSLLGRRSTRLRQQKAVITASPPLAPPIQRLSMATAARVTEKDDLNMTQSDEDIATACGKMEDEDLQTKNEALLKDLKHLMAATKTSSKSRRKNSSKRLESVDQSEDGGSDGTRSRRNGIDDKDVRDSTPLKMERKTGIRRTSKNVNIDQQTEPSQFCEVSWDDPAARAQQQMLALELAKDSESFSPTNVHAPCEQFGEPEAMHAESPKPDRDSKLNVDEIPSGFGDSEMEIPRDHCQAAPTSPIAQVAPPVAHVAPPTESVAPPPLFLLSGMAQEERDDFGALIESLGGQMLDAPHYKSTCTHLVVGNPTRNEKYLACVAAGKWILHKSYLLACRMHEKFVPEADHEWGSAATTGVLQNMSAQVAKLALAANRWRVKLNQGKCGGAFQGWTVALLTDKKKEDGFRRLLEAGGANVLMTNSPDANQLRSLTHAFIELNKLKVQVDIQSFVSADVHCLKPEYIAAYLMDDPPPLAEQYYIPEALDASRSESRKRSATDSDLRATKRLRQ